MEECRGRVARLLGVSLAGVTFLSSTTEGLNHVAHTLDWQPGDEVLIHDREFPSDVYAWANLAKRGVKLRVVHGNDVESFAAALTQRTRLVCVSHVNYATGYKADLDGLGRLAHSAGAYLCVDACQSIGAVRIPMDHVDFLSAGTYKWPLGTFGISVFYVNPVLAGSLAPAFAGHASVTHPFETRYEGFELLAGSQRFQYSTVNYAGCYVLNEGLKLLEAYGLERVYDRVRYLSGLLPGALPDDVRAGIVSIPASAEQVEGLVARKIQVAWRDGMLRISPHFYNNERDLEPFLQ